MLHIVTIYGMICLKMTIEQLIYVLNNRRMGLKLNGIKDLWNFKESLFSNKKKSIYQLHKYFDSILQHVRMAWLGFEVGY